MPVAGPLLHASVTVIGDQALVKLHNRTGSRKTFDVAGTPVTVDGNTVGALGVAHVEGFSITVDGAIVPTTFV